MSPPPLDAVGHRFSQPTIAAHFRLQRSLLLCRSSAAMSAHSDAGDALLPAGPIPQSPRIFRGNTGEVRWEYHTLARVLIQQTPRVYYSTWYDRELRRLRPVLWQCIYVNTDSPREVVETWYWTYVGGL